MSTEQAEDELQAQQDEILVLQAIYGDKIIEERQVNGCTAFTALVQVEVESSELTISAGKNAAAISHLPPLQLSIVLPMEYPARKPPSYTLSSLWLNAMALSSCCEELDKLYEQNHGPILCVWMDWLRYEAAQKLGISANVELRLDDFGVSSSSTDRRALYEGTDPEEDLQELLRYNSQHEHAAFPEALHSCPVCLEEKPGVEFVRGFQTPCAGGGGAACHHIICTPCCREMAVAYINSKEVDSIRCPVPECRAPAPPVLLASLLPDAHYAMYEKLFKEALEASLPGVCHCPRCTPEARMAERKSKGNPYKLQLCKFWTVQNPGACKQGACCKFAHGVEQLEELPLPVACVAPTGSDGQPEDTELRRCPECSYAFCALCLQSYHPGTECMSGAELEEARQRLHDRALEAGKSTSTKAREYAQQQRRRIDELRSLDVIRKSSVPCPGCGVAISRTEGCNHMKVIVHNLE